MSNEELLKYLFYKIYRFILPSSFGVCMNVICLSMTKLYQEAVPTQNAIATSFSSQRKFKSVINGLAPSCNPGTYSVKTSVITRYLDRSSTSCSVLCMLASSVSYGRIVFRQNTFNFFLYFGIC